MTAYADLTRHEQLQSIFWELYKDVHGFRPRHIDTSGWSVERLESQLDALEAMGQQQVEQERKAEEAAAVAFEARIVDLIACGAGDRATALRWIHQAEDTNGDNEFLCHQLGLKYRYFS